MIEQKNNKANISQHSNLDTSLKLTESSNQLIHHTTSVSSKTSDIIQTSNVVRKFLKNPTAMSQPKPTFRVNILDFSLVRSALASGKENLTDQNKFNSHCHSLKEISAVVPDTIHCSPSSTPPWLLLSPWLPLIASSRGIPSSEIHTIILPRPFCVILNNAASRALATTQTTFSGAARITADDSEDFLDTFPLLTAEGFKISELLSGSKSWFIRLDTCSLKDAAYEIGTGAVDRGSQPLTTVKQLAHRLASSARGITGINDLRSSGKDVKVFLLPWDEGVKIEYEYRVFCPPPQQRSEEGGLRISAVSQYRWHKPYYITFPAEIESVAKKVFKGITRIFEEIVETIEKSAEELGDGNGDRSSLKNLLKTGFTFDVVTDADGSNVRFIEMNIFGAMTGCGSCAFHWVNDARILYGLEGDVEFRFVMEMNG
jgi:hypothetical protein